LALGETGGAFEVTLPTTGNNGYAAYCRDLLW